MNRVIEIIKEIQATSSKNEKAEIIKANADNELFKKTLVFLLDGNVVTGINKKKLGKKINPTIVEITTDWDLCIKYLESHNTGKDEYVEWIQAFISVQPEEHREFYEKLITKTLRLGCDAKTVNKGD